MSDMVAPPATTAALTDLLARVRAAKPGEEGEDERLTIARDWCKLWIDRDDYPEIAYLIAIAFSEAGVALGACVALAERVLPDQSWDISKDIDQTPMFAATIYNVGRGWTEEKAATPALALVAALLAALSRARAILAKLDASQGAEGE